MVAEHSILPCKVSIGPHSDTPVGVIIYPWNLFYREIFSKMSDTGACQSTYWRRSVSESESDPMNSTVNLRGNPRMYIPSERAKSNPNISGFIDEYPYTGLGMNLQSQWEGIEIRTVGY